MHSVKIYTFLGGGHIDLQKSFNVSYDEIQYIHTEFGNQMINANNNPLYIIKEMICNE